MFALSLLARRSNVFSCNSQPPYYDEDIQEMNRKILHAPLEFEQGRFTPEAKSILRGVRPCSTL